MVPDVEDVPLVLQGLSQKDIPVLRFLEIHCEDYVRHFNDHKQGFYCIIS